MNITIPFISKTCWSVIHTDKIKIDSLYIPIFEEILEEIHKLHPTLDEEDFDLYWPYSPNDYLHVVNYKSYFTALQLMVRPIILLFLNDVVENHDCVEAYRELKSLDFDESRDDRKSKTSPYDATIVGRDNSSQINLLNFEAELLKEKVCCTKEEIFAYALSKLPKIECFTMDQLQKHNLMELAKKGCAKRKKKLTLIPDEVIERIVKKDKKGKGKKGKKGKKDKKGKKGKKKK